MIRWQRAERDLHAVDNSLDVEFVQGHINLDLLAHGQWPNLRMKLQIKRSSLFQSPVKEATNIGNEHFLGASLEESAINIPDIRAKDALSASCRYNFLHFECILVADHVGFGFDDLLLSCLSFLLEPVHFGHEQFQNLPLVI